jgi:hypothetical protein
MTKVQKCHDWLVSAFDPLQTSVTKVIECQMFGLLYILILVAIAGGVWWFTGSRAAFAAALLVIQLLIWWVANDLDNGVPWNVNRPLLVGSADPIWVKSLILLLLYGPLAAAGWALWKPRA